MLLTKEEYYNRRGIDLAKELGQIDNSNYVNIFLQEQEDWLRNYVDLEFDDVDQSANIDTESVLKEALISQIDYILLKGDINKQGESVLCPNALIILKKNGMANISQTTHRRGRIYARY